MCFLDIKCLVVVYIFETILVSEGLKKVQKEVFTPYRSIYLRNDRRNNHYDYKFKDWESTTPDNIYDLVNMPSNINKNATITTNITSVQTISNVATDKVTAQQEVTATTEATFGNSTIHLNTSSVEGQNSSTTFEETEGITDTIQQEETGEELLEWLASTSPTVYTTLEPPPSTMNIEDLMPQPGDENETPSQIITTKNPFYEEIKNEISQKHGYFSASLHGLLKVISSKNSTECKILLAALNNQIDTYVSKGGLAMFSSLVIETFQSSLQMLILAPDDAREEYIKFAIYAVENRHVAMKDDVNTVFNVIDNIYTDHDLIRVADILKRIDEFKMDTDLMILVTDTLNVYIFDPHLTIKETAKERLLMMELNNMLQHRLYPGEVLERRFGKRKETGKVTRQWKSKHQITNYHQHSRQQSNYKIEGIQHFKHKSPIREVQNKLDRKNTKYDSNKIATTLKYFYEVEDSKKIILENSLQSKSATSSESSSNYNLASRYNHGSKTVNVKYSLKGDNSYLKSYNKALNKNKFKFESYESDQNKDENILKFNLMDAIIHSGKKIKRRQNEKKISKVRYVESFSDEEAILKSNIYKAFGLNNDFQEQVRTLHNFKITSPA